MYCPILVPSRRPTGPGWDQIFFHGMGWDQISVGWDLPVPRQARTGTGWDKTLVGWELPSRSRGQPNLRSVRKCCFNCKTSIDVVNNISERRILTVKITLNSFTSYCRDSRVNELLFSCFS